MVIKIYAFIWLLVFAVAGLLYFSGNANELTIAVMGFIVSTLLAAGVVIVLPWWVDRKYTWIYSSR